VNLSRGPTPLAPSYIDRLKSREVVAFTAGSNAPDAALSHDDNERSTWNSDGQPTNAWIEYDLGTAQAVSSLSLKPTGWRVRTYPLQISIDGKTVFEGDAPKSLGYVDFNFAATKGRKVKIELIRPTQDHDAFGKIIEVTNDRQGASTGAEKVPVGWRLSLIEADILGPAK